MMNKKTLLIVIGLLVGTSVFAQDDYNKWSIDFGLGINNPKNNISPGYNTKDINFFTGDIGVRYMMNEYFGLKVDYGYNSFSNSDNSLAFDADYMRTDLQMVFNLARVLKFQSWTKTIGLLAHAGGGFAWGHSDGFSDYDSSYNLMLGATMQVKLSKRISLNIDGTILTQTSQEDMTFDGWTEAVPQAKNGIMLNATIGLSIYLGKHDVHADWYYTENNMAELLAEHERVSALAESARSDVDTSYVNQKLRSIAKDIEELKMRNSGTTAVDYDDFFKRMTEDGFTSIFFSFDEYTVDEYAIGTANLMNSYLQSNPTKMVEVRGYADDRGSDEYNQALSEKRAQVAAQLLIDAGVDPAQISVMGMGEDKSINKKNSTARKMARRVSFVVQ